MNARQLLANVLNRGVIERTERARLVDQLPETLHPNLIAFGLPEDVAEQICQHVLSSPPVNSNPPEM